VGVRKNVQVILTSVLGEACGTRVGGLDVQGCRGWPRVGKRGIIAGKSFSSIEGVDMGKVKF